MLNGWSESHSYFERVSFPWRPLDHSQHPGESRDPRGLSPGDVSVDLARLRRDSWLLAGSGEISAVHTFITVRNDKTCFIFVLCFHFWHVYSGCCYFEPASQPEAQEERGCLDVDGSTVAVVNAVVRVQNCCLKESFMINYDHTEVLIRGGFRFDP